MCGCLSHAPYWGPDPQPRHVPSLGIELVTLFGSEAGTQSTEPHQPGPPHVSVVPLVPQPPLLSLSTQQRADWQGLRLYFKAFLSSPTHAV